MANEALKIQKKAIIPYLDMAEQIEKVNPKVAYYCRSYAVQQAVNLGSLEPPIKELVGAVMDKLEKTRPTLGINKDTDPAECEKWAMLIFSKADKLDRQGRRDKETRNIFFIAWQYFNVASQFEIPLTEDGKRLKKYAAWRATEMGKALRDGVAPSPPPEVTSPAIGDDDDAFLMNALDSITESPAAAVPTGNTASAPAPTYVPPPPPTEPAEDTVPPIRTASSASGGAPTSLRDFTVGQPVMFCCDGAAHSVENGTVAGFKTGQGNAPSMYIVQLKGRQVVVPGEFLAPCVEPGTSAVYYPDEGPPEDVEVEEIYASRWPPTYLVNRPGYGLSTADDDRLALAPETEESAPPPPVAAAAPAVQEKKEEEKKEKESPPSAPTEEVAGPSSVPSLAVKTNGPAARAGLPPPVPSPLLVMPRPAPIPQVAPVAPPPAPVAPAPLPAPVHVPPPSPQAPPAPVAAAPAAPTAAVGGYSPSLKSVVDAQKLSKEAVSALSFEDVPTAITRLTEALKHLTGRQ